MTTPKYKLINYLVSLIHKRSARFTTDASNLSLTGRKTDRVDLEGGVILKRAVCQNEVRSNPSQEIEIDANGLAVTIESRDLALEWIEAREAAEARMAQQLRKQREDFEEKQAEAMLKALGIQ